MYARAQAYLHHSRDVQQGPTVRDKPAQAVPSILKTSLPIEDQKSCMLNQTWSPDKDPWKMHANQDSLTIINY